MTGQQRVPFTDEDDALLMKYIATYNPQTKGRLGMKLYERLVENAEGKWSFASRHSVHSWRERYKTNQQWFDAKILRYQKKHSISADASCVSPLVTRQSSAGGNGSKKRAREVNSLSPIKKIRLDPSIKTKNSWSPGRVGVSMTPEESPQSSASSSQGRHCVQSPEPSATSTHPSAQPASAPSQSRTAYQPQRVASLKPRRLPSLKRRIVHGEEDDIFCTPPIQSPPSSPSPQAHARDAPRLVEGPYRRAYTRANGGHWPAPHSQHASGVCKETEANGNDWPPRRGTRNDSTSPERLAATDVDLASVQHIDLRVLHSRKSVETFRAGSTASLGSTRTLEKKQPHQVRAPKSSTPPNLSESNKELVLALGLEEVYKRMAENHKFHVDIVREVAAGQRSLEQADQVLRNMREAAEHEYARLLKQKFGVTLGTGVYQSEESDDEEADAENLKSEEHGRSALSQPASPCPNHSPPNLPRIDGGGYMDGDADAVQKLDKVPTKQADSSLPGSPTSRNMEWTDDDDELLLDGDLVVHEELVR